MTDATSGGARMLPSLPYTVVSDTVPGRMSLQVIEKAFAYGWTDEKAEADLNRGRQALQGRRWHSNEERDARLMEHRRRAVKWLAANATPLGFELHDQSVQVVLRGRSDIL